MPLSLNLFPVFLREIFHHKYLFLTISCIIIDVYLTIADLNLSLKVNSQWIYLNKGRIILYEAFV